MAHNLLYADLFNADIDESTINRLSKAVKRVSLALAYFFFYPCLDYQALDKLRRRALGYVARVFWSLHFSELVNGVLVIVLLSHERAIRCQSFARSLPTLQIIIDYCCNLWSHKSEVSGPVRISIDLQRVDITRVIIQCHLFGMFYFQ